ncbi:Fanconi anemia group J protein [Seriola lalandi dorsalis]|uniref:Fanconi anemia group J protein n=1 Tax=Seriola lalandi dorsalis TaxID=1841481 RepID=UPI000C6FAB55|nr:Fanconi anemia group J protein [Seriola lalandi dorsalis]
MATPRVEYTIGGVKIHFPCKAYPSQLAMMNSIVRGLNYGQHCLLESPTGSGKSLALLCSALGWQRAQLAKLQEGGGTGDDKSQSDKCAEDCNKSDVTSVCQCVCHNKACRPSATPAATPASATPAATAASATPATPAAAAAAVDPDVVDLNESPCKETTQLQPPAPGQTPLQDESQPRKQSIASRLSEKFQSAANKDDDFQPDRKRIRTAEHKGRKRQRLEKGVIFIDDDSELENEPPDQSVSTETNNPAAGLFSSYSPLEPCSWCPCASAKESVKDKDKDKDKDGKKKMPKIFFGTRTHKQITQIAHELKRTVYSSVPMTILSSRDHTCINPEVAPHSNRNERCKDLLEGKDGRSCRFYHGVQRMRDHQSLRASGLREAWDIEDLVSLGKRLRSCSYYAARELMQSAAIIFCPYNYLLDPMIRESMEIDLAGQILVLDEAHNIEDCARESASYTLDRNNLLTCKDELDSMVKNKIRASKHEPLRNFCYSLINWIQESQGLLSERGYETASKVWNGKDILGIFHDLGITAGTFNLLKQNLAAVLEKEERVGLVNGKEDMVQVPVISSASSTVLKNLFMVLDFLFRDNCRFAEDYRVALQRTYAWSNQLPPDVPDAQGFLVRPRYRQRQSARVKTEVLTLNFWCLNPAVAFSDLSGSVHSIVLTSGTLSPMGSFSSELGVKFSIQLEANHVINKSQVWVGTIGAGPQGRKLCATFQHTETYTFQDEVGALLLHICQVVAKGVLCFLPSYKMLDKLRDRWVNTGLWEKLEQQKTVITEPRGGGKGDFDELLQTYYDAIKYCEERDGALLIAVCRGKVSEGLDFTDDNARAVVTIGIPFPNIKDLQVCVCVTSGLSKWVRQLVQHHDTFNNAMQSLVAFSQVQQKAAAAAAERQTPDSTASSPNGHLPVTAEGRGPASHPQTPPVKAPEPQQHRSPSPPRRVSPPHVKTEQNGKADWLKSSSPAKPPSHQQRPARPFYNIFTSTPVSSRFKKAVFRGKAPADPEKHLEEAPTQSEPQKKKNAETPACLQDGAADTSGEIKAEPRDTPSTVTTPPICEQEEKADKEEEKDQTVFYTPELFEGEGDEGGEGGEGDEGGPETKSESPPRAVLAAEISPLLSEELLTCDQARGETSGDQGQSALSVRKENAQLSQGREEEPGGQKSSEEEEVNKLRRKVVNRLSRSRHKPTGNERPGHEKT